MYVFQFANSRVKLSGPTFANASGFELNVRSPMFYCLQGCSLSSSIRGDLGFLSIWMPSSPKKRSSKSNWTEEEDKILADVVHELNGKNWKRIAEHIPGRTDVQCLHRWQKFLDPNLVKGAWTKEEDEQIIKLVEEQGSNKKWSLIAKSLPGRIGKQCRESQRIKDYVRDDSFMIASSLHQYLNLMRKRELRFHR